MPRADPGTPGPDGRTPYHEAVRKGQARLAGLPAAMATGPPRCTPPRPPEAPPPSGCCVRTGLRASERLWTSCLHGQS
jgi:hypothetical protein